MKGENLWMVRATERKIAVEERSAGRLVTGRSSRVFVAILFGLLSSR